MSWVQRHRQRQGLPPFIEDRATLARLSRLIGRMAPTTKGAR